MLRSSPSTPSKTGASPRRSSRLMRNSTSTVAAAALGKSDSSSSFSSVSGENRRKKRRLKDMTNTSREKKKKKKSEHEESFIKKPPETNAVTPNANATREEIDFERQIARQLEERMTSPTTNLPRGVVELYPRRWTPCVCDQNHSSCSSQSHVFLHQYGRDYYKSLKDWDEFCHSYPSSENSNSSLDSDSGSYRFATRVSLTPPSGVNYALRGYMEDQSSNDSSSVVTHQRLPNQPNLTQKMRCVLVDWLIELSEEYSISPKTLHLTVALLNQSLECGASQDQKRQLVITRDMFQCLGCACMWMAAKMEEVTPPSITDFCYISADSYTRKDIADMEMAICSALEFRLWHVTPYHFIEELLRASVCEKSRHLACPIVHSGLERSMVLYLLELSMLPFELVKTSPRKIAAAAVYLSRVVLGIDDGVWTSTLEHYSGFSKWELEDHVLSMHRQHSAAEESKLDNVFTKYSKEKYHKVALKTVPLRQSLGF
mmetsp:Transcript_26628/g.39384  ORF Transcript_26628/g.39384 Transcript_26628/m.39384 type:complete len:487 (-) Transcript_26628:952-2412(-)|eukprot:CAMPEP_0194213868 /NCGR_PEP_ID=MMETSP0156-20130528/14748_1 /TAXON_ID=33649 /ORGANISM="Thalassionema nitzschioides, Strain L26-B" /LENGTH=486 /DNA_ID=CAMNT_0038942001 /DNA_START=106 /DNA_END=1566 /DNA_ORIENTATION=-